MRPAEPRSGYPILLGASLGLWGCYVDHAAAELMHLSDPVAISHGSGFFNAFRLQGLVSDLEGLSYNRDNLTGAVPEAAGCAGRPVPPMP